MLHAVAMAPAHPLQRLVSPSRTASLLVHLLGIASFSVSFKHLREFPHSLHDSFGGNYQFLTIIGLSLAQISFVLGALADLTLSPQLFAAKNAVAVCAAPLQVLISMLYWGISLIDRSLLFPPEVRLRLDVDLGFHGVPAILLAIDLLLLSPPWTMRAHDSMGLSMVLAFVYWGWVEYCFSHNGLQVAEIRDTSLV